MEEKSELLELAVGFEKSVDLGTLVVAPIVTDEDYTNAGEQVKRNAAFKKKVTDFFSDPKSASYKAWKAICDLESKYLKLVEDSDSLLRQGMTGYRAMIAEKQRKAEEEARKAREEAERKAREEAAAKEKEAEEKRRQLEEQAQAAMDQKDDGKAEELLKEIEEIKPVEVVPVEPVFTPPPPPPPPKVEGIRITKYWSFEITDEEKIPAYLDFNGAKFMLRTVSDSALKNLAKTFKGQVQVPGVRFFETEKTEVTGR